MNINTNSIVQDPAKSVDSTKIRDAMDKSFPK